MYKNEKIADTENESYIDGQVNEMERKNGKNLRAWELALLAALCLTLCAGLWAQKKQGELASQVVRLHVLAVDDSEEEQALKLRVRDAVLAYLSPALAGVNDRDEARQLLAGRLREIAEAAADAAEGRKVSVSLGPESYPLRRYEGFVLPAGTYESLRVVLPNVRRAERPGQRTQEPTRAHRRALHVEALKILAHGHPSFFHSITQELAAHNV